MADLRDLWDFSDPVASEARFDLLIADLADALERAEALTQKARAQGLQRRFEDARETLELAAREAGDAPSSALAAYWLELGRVENSSGHKPASESCFVRALEVARGCGNDFLAVDAAHMLGIVAEDSLAWNERAIAMAEASSEPKVRNWLGSLLNNTGWAMYAQGDYPRALETFRKALAFREDQGQAENIRIARYCIAKTLRAMGQIEESLNIQATLEQELLADGQDAGYNWEEIGECLISLGRAEEARPFFKRAYGTLSKNHWFVAEEPERLERLKTLGS